MTHRTTVRLALLLGLLPSAEVTRAAPLPLAECLDPARARAWHMLDSDALLVDAGRRRFHVTLAFSCPELAFSHDIVFRPGNGVGRVCGNSNDAVVPLRTTALAIPCTIASIRRIDKQEFDALATGNELRGVIEVREGDATSREPGAGSDE